MKEDLIETVTARVLSMLGQSPSQPRQSGGPRAFLVGTPPGEELGYTYVREPPYEAVVVGSLTAGQLLNFRQEETLQALLTGLPVYIYGPGLPTGSGKNRALETALGSSLSRLRTWGVRVLEGRPQRRLITAQEARSFLEQGIAPPPGSLLTPTARDILDGKA